MALKKTPLILWTGPKHGGKTTTATRLVQAVQERGLVVGGFLAPSRYEAESLLGFDLWDLALDRRIPLATLQNPVTPETDRFRFDPSGLTKGRQILDGQRSSTIDLIVVDEFGPWEIQGQGWRPQVDRLVACFSGVVLLVVRESLIRQVRDLYKGRPCVTIPALAPDAISLALASIEQVA